MKVPSLLPLLILVPALLPPPLLYHHHEPTYELVPSGRVSTTHLAFTWRNPGGWLATLRKLMWPLIRLLGRSLLSWSGGSTSPCLVIHGFTATMRCSMDILQVTRWYCKLNSIDSCLDINGLKNQLWSAFITDLCFWKSFKKSLNAWTMFEDKVWGLWSTMDLLLFSITFVFQTMCQFSL